MGFWYPSSQVGYGWWIPLMEPPTLPRGSLCLQLALLQPKMDSSVLGSGIPGDTSIWRLWQQG